MTADYQWPEGLVPNSAEWEFVPNTLSSSSRFTNKVKNVLLQGSRWQCSYMFNSVELDIGRKLSLVQSQIAGGIGTIDVPVYGKSYGNEINWAGRVNGDGQFGLSVITDGWPANETIFRAGQMVGINGELKTVTADVISNSAGEAVISITPEFRNAPPDNTLITHAPALVTMEEVPGSSQTMSHSPGTSITGNFSTVTLSLREVVN